MRIGRGLGVFAMALLGLAGCSAADRSATDEGSALSQARRAAGLDAGLDAGTDAGLDVGAAEQAVVAAVEQQMAAYPIPGAQLALVIDGKLAFRQSFGVKEHGQSDPVTDASLFRVASLSKMIAATTALSLVDDGALDTSVPVTTYIPSWKLAAGYDPSTVTLDELMSHHAGLRDLSISWLRCATGDGALAGWFSTDTESSLWTPPGAVFNYSNRGYSVAGWAIESAGGAPFEDLVAARVFAPAGMATATYDPTVAVAGDHAVGHEYDASTGQLTPHDMTAYDCAATHPPAGVMATATDYAHFVETLFANDGSMLSPASLATLTTGRVDTDAYPTERYAYGFYDYLYKGQLHVIHHDGAFDSGYLSQLWMVPEAKFAVILFYNSTANNGGTVAKGALDTFFGLTDTPYPVVTTPPSTWGPYVGSYVDPHDLKNVTVRLQGSSLLVDIPEKSISGGQLSQISGDAFSMSFDGGPLEVTFFPGATGTSDTPRPWFVTRQGVGARQP